MTGGDWHCVSMKFSLIPRLHFLFDFRQFCSIRLEQVNRKFGGGFLGSNLAGRRCLITCKVTRSAAARLMVHGVDLHFKCLSLQVKLLLEGLENNIYIYNRREYIKQRKLAHDPIYIVEKRVSERHRRLRLPLVTNLFVLSLRLIRWQFV